MVILVTGASGFIGNAVACMLEESSNVVIRATSNKCIDKTNWVQIDLANTEPIKLAINPEVIIHCAAETDFTKGFNYLKQVNEIGTKKLVEFSIDVAVRKFIYISTGGVYGFSDIACTENSELKPVNDYSLTKLLGERVVIDNKYLNSFLVLRLFFPYGENQTNRLIPNLFTNIYSGKQIQFHGEHGLPTINPIYIEDFLSILARMLMCDLTGVYNVAGIDKVTILDIARIISAKLNRKMNSTFLVPTSKNLIGCIDKLVQDAGGYQYTSINEGLENVYQNGLWRCNFPELSKL